MFEFQVQWVPVVVAMIANMALGFVWFAMPVFGRTWLAATGKTMEQLKQGTSNAMLYTGAVLGSLVVAYAIALIIENGPIFSFADAIYAAIILWAAFYAVPTFVNYSFEGHSWMLYLIYIGNQLVAFLLSAGIYYAWPTG